MLQARFRTSTVERAYSTYPTFTQSFRSRGLFVFAREALPIAIVEERNKNTENIRIRRSLTLGIDAYSPSTKQLSCPLWQGKSLERRLNHTLSSSVVTETHSIDNEYGASIRVYGNISMTRFSHCTIATRDYWPARIFATKRTIKISRIPPKSA